MRATLEYAVDYSIGLETGIAASSGAFPYVGHLSYTYDGKLAKGSRITKLELLDANGQWQPLDDEKVYRVGANTYIAPARMATAVCSSVKSCPTRVTTSTPAWVRTRCSWSTPSPKAPSTRCPMRP
ncbi:5'-nucleotidase C-terminal domain-containing protein [Aeromonas caviae]|uniref:5'-nucleotidase C-terminal domain-containing protein n=1 Tax=Aeromonas caviae TaxID=648 RepID=UPI003F7A77DF